MVPAAAERIAVLQLRSLGRCSGGCAWCHALERYSAGMALRYTHLRRNAFGFPHRTRGSVARVRAPVASRAPGSRQAFPHALQWRRSRHLQQHLFGADFPPAAGRSIAARSLPRVGPRREAGVTHPEAVRPLRRTARSRGAGTIRPGLRVDPTSRSLESQAISRRLIVQGQRGGPSHQRPSPTESLSSINDSFRSSHSTTRGHAAVRR